MAQLQNKIMEHFCLQICKKKLLQCIPFFFLLIYFVNILFKVTVCLIWLPVTVSSRTASERTSANVTKSRMKKTLKHDFICERLTDYHQPCWLTTPMHKKQNAV